MSTASDAYIDCVCADPHHYRIMLENQQVRVVRVTFAAGETSPEHDHPARLTVFLRDYETTNQLADGAIDHRMRRAGETEWRPPVRHVPYAKTSFDNIQVEMKSASRAGVLRIRLRPAEAMPHGRTDGVLVFLTAFRGEFLRGEDLVQEEGPAGTVIWVDATRRLMRNSGNQVLEVILVAAN